MALYGYVLGTDPDDTNLWNSRFIPSSANNFGGQNYSGWRNAEIDNLTVAAARTSDPEQRKPYFRIQELIAGELPCIPLFFRANIDVIKNRVVNFQPSPTGGQPLECLGMGISGELVRRQASGL